MSNSEQKDRESAEGGSGIGVSGIAKKRYKLILDPHYEASMISEKTQKTWIDASKRIMKERTERDPGKGETLLSNQELVAEKEYEEFHNTFYVSSSSEDEIFYDEDPIEEESQNIFGIKRSATSTSTATSTTKNLVLKDKPVQFLDLDEGENVMFQESGMRVNDVVQMIVAYSVRFGSTHRQREWLLEMFKNCAGPKFKNLNISNYKISNICNPPEDKICYNFYCDQCIKKEELLFSGIKRNIKGQKKTCNKCKKEQLIILSNPHYFMTSDLEYQLRLLFKNKEIAKIVQEHLNNDSKEKSKAVLRDITDSQLHRSAVQFTKNTFTYTISTDGAPLFSISKRSFWPLQISLNFLPPYLRFKFILLVGVMIVRHEPKPDLMNLYINVFMKQAQSLQSDGVKIKVLGLDEELVLKFSPICVVADSVARPILQNRLQYNGYYGCSYCYQQGQYVHKAGMKYPFTEEQPELRRHMSHMQDVDNVNTLGCSTVRGVKGESAFCSNPNIDMVWGFPLDYMHNAILGVTEQLWTEWNKNILSPKQRNEIDELLLLIQPPRDLHRVPEKISAKSVWKATHWKSWLLYYSLPILSKLLPTNLLEHYCLFVNSIYVLLKTEIYNEELNKCEEDLLIFVAEFQTLYGIERMTFNVHILLHAVASVRMSGPLWCTSSFPFEHNIFFCKDSVNGPKSVEQQMIKNSLTRLAYQVKSKDLEVSNVVNEFCKNLFSAKTVTISAFKLENCTLFGPCAKNKFQLEQEFARCQLNNQVYSSIKYLRSNKYNDTIVLLNNGTIAQIMAMKVLNDKCWLEIRKLILKPFVVGDSKVNHIWEVVKNSNHENISILDVNSKIVGLDFREKQYVCTIPNCLEAQ